MISTTQKCKILDPLNISGTAKATNFQKLLVWMTGILGPGAEPIMGKGGMGEGGVGSGALPPETKHLHTCQSILLAILFKNILKILKILLHCYIPVRDHLPHLPLYNPRPVAEIWYGVGCNSAQRLDLFAWCVRLRRLLIGKKVHGNNVHGKNVHGKMVHGK